MTGPAGLRVLLIDDDPIVPDYVKQMLLRQFPDSTCQFAVTVAQGKGVLATAGANFNLILLDLLLPDGSGIEILDFLRSVVGPLRVPVIMTSGVNDRTVAEQCRQAGAMGYVARTDLPTELIPAVFAVCAGQEHFPILNFVHGDNARAGGANDGRLPERLRAIAALLGQGKSAKEVASELAISEATVRNAMPDLMRFFSVATRGELLRALAAKAGHQDK